MVFIYYCWNKISPEKSKWIKLSLGYSFNLVIIQSMRLRLFGTKCHLQKKVEVISPIKALLFNLIKELHLTKKNTWEVLSIVQYF